uniref:Uncharacterized protein n=1 Tax=Cucumis melo TaxID=3656 RepID=A0A9I9E6D4_CUCME
MTEDRVFVDGEDEQKHDRGFDFREQGGRREGSCERFRVMANKEDKQKVRARDL